MDGDRKESPRYTDRMADVSSEDAAVLLTKPLAPASITGNTYSLSSYWVNTITFACGNSLCMRRVASSPSIRGMAISMSTTSSASFLPTSRASLPLVASPTASMSPVRASKAQMPSRTMAWSSVTSTLIFVISNVLTYWNLGPNRRSCSNLGLDAAGAAKKADPLSHTEQSATSPALLYIGDFGNIKSLP